MTDLFELLFVSLTGTTLHFRKLKHSLFLEFAGLTSPDVILSGEHYDVMLLLLFIHCLPTFLSEPSCACHLATIRLGLLVDAFLKFTESLLVTCVNK